MSLELEKVSTHNWSAAGAPSQRTQVQEEHASQPDGHVQIMYRKDQVYQEDAEFSLEELRAQHYYRSLNERASHLKKLKQDLRRQIEEKQSLLQQRSGAAADEEPAGSCGSGLEALSRSPAQREDPRDHGDSACRRSGRVLCRLDERDAEPSTGSDQNTLTNTLSSSSSRVSLKLPSLSLKAEQVSGKESRSSSGVSKEGSASVSRSEEAIVSGHLNKTLCRSPDDTREFARAAQLASTPFAGVERIKASGSGVTENQSPAAPESSQTPSSEENKLSPILEISQEWCGASFSTKQLKGPEISRAGVTEPEDVCGLGVRSRLFDQTDMTSFSDFQQKSGRLPDSSGDLRLDGEVLVHCGEMETLKDFTLYFSSSAAVLLKVDRSGVPWDFFISSQLRSRGSGEADADVQVCCDVFEDGCWTLWRLPRGHTLQDLVSESRAGHDVSLLVVLLLELVKRLHSCRVVHGGLRPASLYYYVSGITALDFSNSVDLQLQTDVTAAQDLPSAQKYIQQGLLMPSASPYQVDLIGVAEVVHMLLFNHPLKVKQENSSWSLDEGAGSQSSVPVKSLWRDFFHMILNPEGKSSELLLSELISTVKNSL
ncbi:mitotic checkpoint serine/threonine-protein kinase BUB1 beta isoform X2 [Puntigrus tetrazona]|uniref:mitotic checkpoint serine/threonine-protein kinase BUB1 beta isoform X2 n=1 Tax=Puntigrus tetrazona TaxID=1606681 RepID=UPI001C897E5F|nr:mitotic checkpoint serine/threonine-protein kinase BUB1 beta isoform X2 [Puntigrus tetrazona]